MQTIRGSEYRLKNAWLVRNLPGVGNGVEADGRSVVGALVVEKKTSWGLQVAHCCVLSRRAGRACMRFLFQISGTIADTDDKA